MDGRSSRWSHESERTDVNPLKVDDSKRSKVETFLDRSLLVEWHQTVHYRTTLHVYRFGSSKVKINAISGVFLRFVAIF